MKDQNAPMPMHRDDSADLITFKFQRLETPPQRALLVSASMAEPSAWFRTDIAHFRRF
jgi:hypothetical protein